MVLGSLNSGWEKSYHILDLDSADYTINTDGFMVQQLIVQRPIMKSFLDPELVIGRSEVVEINDDAIIVRDEESKIRVNATREDFVPNFVNPFREPRLSTAMS